jgi:hypothetical protein
MPVASRMRFSVTALSAVFNDSIEMMIRTTMRKTIHLKILKTHFTWQSYTPWQWGTSLQKPQ